MIRKSISVTILMATLMVATPIFAATHSAQQASNKLFQVSTLYALESGQFEGFYPYRDLMAKGNFGIGTFTAIDGELVAVDGQYYQSTADCHLRKVSSDLMSPFAEIMNFQPSSAAITLADVNNLKDLDKLLTNKFPNKNLPYAIRIDGTFNLTVRSLRKQERPFPNLLEATKTQCVLRLNNVKGSVVGFWFPHYWEGIGMPGTHVHFASADRQLGGHILEIEVKQGKAQLEAVENIEVQLPKSSAFANAELDISKLEPDLQKAEGDGNH